MGEPTETTTTSEELQSRLASAIGVPTEFLQPSLRELCDVIAERHLIAGEELRRAATGLLDSAEKHVSTNGWSPHGSIRRTEHLPTGESPRYTIRWAHGDEERVLRVEFAIFDVSGVSDGEIVYGELRDLCTIDDASPLIEGFVKWDGCTQWHSEHVHFDNLGDMRALIAAIETAREVAAEMMPGTDVAEEYGNR